MRKATKTQNDAPLDETVVDTSATVSKRVNFLMIFEAVATNPNGDPDFDNRPRRDDDGVGYVTNYSIKRAVRDTVPLVIDDEEASSDGVSATGFEIMIVRDKPQNITLEEANAAIKPPKGGVLPLLEREKAGQAYLCKRFYDVRAFGGVLSTGKIKNENEDEASDGPKTSKPTSIGVGKLTGPVVFQSIGKSFDQVNITQVTNTRVSKVEAEKVGQPEMGSGYFVEYGLYSISGHINPVFANGPRQTATGFSVRDQQILFKAIKTMFSVTCSAGRNLHLKRFFVFEEEGKIGSQEADVIRAIKVGRRDLGQKPISLAIRKPEVPAKNFYDYEIVLDKALLPKGTEFLSEHDIDTPDLAALMG